MPTPTVPGSMARAKAQASGASAWKVGSQVVGGVERVGQEQDEARDEGFEQCKQ